jgi:hypothetical protein
MLFQDYRSKGVYYNCLPTQKPAVGGLMEPTRMDIQGTFREHEGNIQGTFREHSGNIQGTFIVLSTSSTVSWLVSTIRQ